MGRDVVERDAGQLASAFILLEISSLKTTENQPDHVTTLNLHFTNLVTIKSR